MAQRVAVIGILNKRNGIAAECRPAPRASRCAGRTSIVRLRACETTAPWEEEKLTGAFVQVDVQKPDRTWKRVFSGWLYKESPSLNVVEHPVYDVWPKSCAMTYPPGPPAPAAPAASSNGSSAPKSAGERRQPPGASTRRLRRRQARRTATRHRSARGTVDRAERGEVLGHELAVEKREIADLEARDEPGQRDLRRVGSAAEHAFAEEGAAEADAVEAAGELARRSQTSIEWAWPEA